MSPEDNEMENCRFDNETNTRIITKLHRVSWTIENVSYLFQFYEIKGPKFYFMNTCLSHLTFVKLQHVMLIKLYNKSNQAMKIIKSKLVLLDCDGAKLDETKTQFKSLQRGQYVILMIKLLNDPRTQLNSLKGDKLVIDCCLKVSTHIATKSNSFKSKTESQYKLLNDLKMLFNDPDSSDFTFQVGEDLIHAHKAILGLRSVYFKRMFLTEMKENAQNSVIVTDISYNTLKNLVEFLYTGNFTMPEERNNVKEVLDLYVAADKYQVMDLRSLCAGKLISSASVDNILAILQLAERYHDENLKSEAMKFVSFQFNMITKSNTWEALVSNEVNLTSEVLSFCSRF